MGRIEVLTFRVTKDESKIIEELVKKSRLKQSEFFRRSILGKKITVIEGIESLVEEIRVLRSISNNLNQLTVLAHQGKIEILNINDLEKLKEKVDNIWPLLNSLMEKMRK